MIDELEIYLRQKDEEIDNSFFKEIDKLAKEYIKNKKKVLKEYKNIYDLIIDTNNESLKQFEGMIEQNTTQEEWISFFSKNYWLLGYALHYKYSRITDDAETCLYIGARHFGDEEHVAMEYFCYFAKLINIYTCNTELDKTQVDKTVFLQKQFNETDVQDIVDGCPHEGELVGDGKLETYDVIIKKTPILITGMRSRHPEVISNISYAIDAGVEYISFSDLYDNAKYNIKRENELIWKLLQSN